MKEEDKEKVIELFYHACWLNGSHVNSYRETVKESLTSFTLLAEGLGFTSAEIAELILYTGIREENG